MKQTANGNYIWLVLLVFFIIVPVVNAFTKRDEGPQSWQAQTETAVEIPAKPKK